jgi:hypothetical protein
MEVPKLFIRPHQQKVVKSEPKLVKVSDTSYVGIPGVDEGIEQYDAGVEAAALGLKRRNKKLADLQAKKDEYKARRADSDNWIKEQKEAGNLTTEDEIAAYERVRKYVEEYYNQGIISAEEYAEEIKSINKSVADTQKSQYSTAIDKAYYVRDDMVRKGDISPDQEIASLKRIQEFIQENYDNRVIDYKTYADDIRKIDEEIFNTRKQYIEDELKDAVDAEKDKLDARKRAIEDYYDELDLKDKQTERAEKLAELQKQEAIYQGAATREGKERLKKIQDEIKGLNKETVKEAREIEKNGKLRVVQDDYDKLDSKQKELIKNISKYASESADAIETITKRIQDMLAAVTQASAAAVPTGTQTAGTTPGAGGVISVNYNDYGAKQFADNSDIKDFGGEIVNGAKNAAAAKGVRL